MALNAAVRLRDASACEAGIDPLTRLLPQIEHPPVRGDVLNSCGNAQSEVLNDTESARANLEAAYASFEEAGYEEGRARAAHNLATYHRNCGRYDEAITWYERDLAYAREVGDRHDEPPRLLGQTLSIGELIGESFRLSLIGRELE